MAELKDRLRADLTESIRTGNELRTGDDPDGAHSGDHGRGRRRRGA
jgi:hypothetical protein